MPVHRQRGFTLMELMVVVAIVAILSAIALPSYRAYVARSQVTEAFDMLSSYASRMEQTYQDGGRYDLTTAGVCTPTKPVGKNFTMTCVIGGSGQSYVATVSGSGPMNGYAYTITNTSARATTAHPKGTNSTCWTARGGSSCDG